jgi:general secretion pathway protein D
MGSDNPDRANKEVRELLQKVLCLVCVLAAVSNGTTGGKEQSSAGTGIDFPKLTDPKTADELISVNFDQVDIRVVLKTIGDITGINFIVDENVRGTVTVMSPTKIRLGDVYEFLESILEVKGCAAIPAGDVVKIVPRAEAAKRNLQVRIGSDPCEISKTDSLVTQIIPLTHADVTAVSEIIRPLLPKDAYMATYPKTNSILIADTSSNIHYIAEIIQTLDVEEKVKIIPLKYASAKVLSEQITRIMEKSRAASAQTGGTRVTPQTEAGIKILPDVRTNSLVVIANQQDARTIETLVANLDVERPSTAGNVHVVYLKNAQAKEVATSLTAALANLKITGALEGAQEVQVSADEGTNALIVTASAQDFQIIADIIDKLDIVREQVVVDMLIVEVSEDTLKEIGIDWATIDNAVADSVRFFGATNFGPRVDFIGGDWEGFSVGAWKQTSSGPGIAAILQALEQNSGVNILSKPNIVTSNHNKAKIVVGENIPFVLQSRITEPGAGTLEAIRTFEYRDVGIILEVTPHVSQSGLIRLELNSEFTKFIDTGSLDTQRTTKREAQTNVTMNSGSTVVIGGLIRDDKVTVEKKIPLVGDIPLVGELFKMRRDQLQKTNLLMFITPHVMGNQDDLDRITTAKKSEMKEATEGLRQKQDEP